ncbi:MAG: phasin family protein [Acetobacteraceae bacterium]|nr:phasin family protein [Acetobacteraceae bacterium]
MLQRSKSNRSSRRAAPPVEVAADEAPATSAEAPPPAAEAGTVITGETAMAVAVELREAGLPHGPLPESNTTPPGAAVAARITQAGPLPAAVETIPAPAVIAAQSGPALPETRAQGAQRMTTMEITMTQANKATETMMKAAEEAAEFGRGNVEALTKATQIYVAGVQDLGRQTFAMMQGLTDQAIEGAKALGSVKSLHEVAQIQSSLARAAMERSVAETAKLGEQALRLTEQAFAPLNARFTLATEKFARSQVAA